MLNLQPNTILSGRTRKIERKRKIIGIICCVMKKKKEIAKKII